MNPDDMLDERAGKSLDFRAGCGVMESVRRFFAKGFAPAKLEEWYRVWAPVAVLFLIFAAERLPQLQGMNGGTANLLFRLRSHWGFDSTPDPRVVLVKIDQKSLDKLQRWPWSRTVHGDFLQLLTLREPSVVAFDLFFSEPSQDVKADEHFAKGIGMLPQTITGAVGTDVAGKELPVDLGRTRPLTRIEGDQSRIPTWPGVLLPIEGLKKEGLFGFVNNEPSGMDGIRRHYLMLARVGDRVFPSLVLQALCVYWKIQPEQVMVKLGRFIELPSPEGVRRIPIDEKGRMPINYRRLFPSHDKEGKISAKVIGYADLTGTLGKCYRDNVPWPSNYPEIEGAILLVGQTEPGLTDFGPSPLEPLAPLVYTHLHVFNSVFKKDYLKIVPFDWGAFPWLAIGWGTLYGLRKSRIFTLITVPLVAVAAYLGGVMGMFFFGGTLLPVFWPVAGYVLLQLGINGLYWWREQRSRQQIKKMFSAYVGPRVMDRVMLQKDEIKLGGERKAVTILFSDIRGFTTMSEGLSEEELVGKLNEYFERMVDCVTRFDGTLHKYIGDAVMAVWGDVVSTGKEIDARHAVRAALAMQDELKGLNERWKAAGRPPIKIGIGLNHGEVVVGNMGAPQRVEFTVIGDAVNLASRLEGLTKTFGIVLAVSENVKELLGEEFLTRTVGLIQVQGKTKAVRVYEVLSERKDGAMPPGFEWVEVYEKGFEAYLARQFEEGIRLFEETLRRHPGDVCAEKYLKACQEYRMAAPPPDWDGVLIMKSK
ncbi:MAG: adenylate/guanylate cyclase domain-containing protein [Verrucomicrobiae bacterium]|nr:adenylate/guanylate cyclase domain-containing protein [Verrucomicrobiae bacterium]